MISPLMPSLHARLAGITLLALLLWGVTSVRMEQKKAELIPTVTIAIEHTAIAQVSITRTTKGNGPIDIQNDSDEVLHISVPETWTRDEVRHAPLSAVVADEPSLGFRRWSIPRQATVTFLSPTSWGKLHIRNIADTPVRVRIRQIDLAQQSSTVDSYLISDSLFLQL